MNSPSRIIVFSNPILTYTTTTPSLKISVHLVSTSLIEEEMEEVMNQKDSSYEKFLENSPENIEKQLHDKLEELEQSKQEINALKVINAKLLTQLQYERTQKLNTSTNTTLQSPSISSPLSQASSGVNKNKKKKNKNINPEESKLQTQSIDEHFITEDNIINSTVQDLLINLQMENQKLTSDILVLEEEVQYQFSL